MTDETGWRPIETALKRDEEHVLVWIQYTPEETARAGEPGRREVARWSEHCGGWLLDHDCCNERHNITLWQPLPPPPTPKETA